MSLKLGGSFLALSGLEPAITGECFQTFRLYKQDCHNFREKKGNSIIFVSTKSVSRRSGIYANKFVGAFGMHSEMSLVSCYICCIIC